MKLEDYNYFKVHNFMKRFQPFREEAGMSVIEKILDLIERNDISARKLTTELGLANSCVSEWKKGKAKPSIDAIVKIASYFGVTTDYLLLEEITADSENDVSESSESIAEETLSSGIIGRGMYNTRRKLPEDISPDERKLLDYYKKLDEENREYIRSKIIVLIKESMDYTDKIT